MSNPDNAAAQSQSDDVTFEQQVNDVVSESSFDEKGNLVLPTDTQVPPTVLYAAKIEKRRRDTQSALSKTTQELAAFRSVNQELQKRVAAQVKISLTPEDAERLEGLKSIDPDAWRAEVNKLEAEATTKVNEELSLLTDNASQQTELERRKAILEQHNQTAKVKLDDDVLANDIPLRLTNQLSRGKITFEEFLEKAEDYLTKGKVVKTDTPPSNPNLNEGGSADLSNSAQQNQSDINYEKQLF